MGEFEVYKISFPLYGIMNGHLIEFDNSDCEYSPGYMLHCLTSGYYYEFEDQFFDFPEMIKALRLGTAKIKKVEVQNG
jgi:hypothetical protein